MLEPDDIRALIEDRVEESRVLEYKRSLPGGGLEDKKDFLADVSAFANTAGGVIVYGIETERDERGQDMGVPLAIAGVDLKNYDQEKLRLTQIIHNGLAPSLVSGLSFQALVLESRSVLLCGVPRSIAGPHMVLFQGARRFWRRSTAGNYQPDVAELRQMFLESQSWILEADEFRRNRFAAIQSREIYPRIDTSSFALFHVLPLGRMDETLDLRSHVGTLRPIGPPSSFGWNDRFNADGFITYADSTPGVIRSYVQWFRFGGMEAYLSPLVSFSKNFADEERRVLLVAPITELLETYSGKGIETLRGTFDRDVPYVMLASFHGIKGTRILSEHGLGSEHEIERDQLILPATTLEDPSESVADALVPLLDVIWQSAGYAGAPPSTRK